MDIKIAIAYHKPSVILDCKHFLPIHAGKALSTYDLRIQGDDEGDSISEKNPWYCELTALYWLWKNTTADYKGLMHYRRIFVQKRSFVLYRALLRVKYKVRQFSSLWSKYNSVGVKKQYGCDDTDVFRGYSDKLSAQLESLLSDGTNIIAPHPGRFYMSVRRTLCNEVGGYNLDMLEEIVKSDYPKFYPYYQKAMNGTWFYNCNMSIMDNDTFGTYCEMLFDILRKHEEATVSKGYLLDVSKEKAYSRISGYLAEMLTNAFIQYSKALGKKVKVMPVIYLNIK